MTDIEQVLRDAAPPSGELGLERVYREGRRRQQRPAIIAGAIATLAAIAVVSVVATTRHERANAPVTAPPTTQLQVTVPSTTAPTTTIPPVTTIPAPGENQLSRASRLGYAGLGPVKLGMTLTEASEAAGTPIAHHGPQACNPQGTAYADEIWTGTPTGTFVVFGVGLDDRIVTIRVFDPAISTLSGIHIGSTEADVLSTYPNGQVGKGIYGNRVVRITNAEGREIVFFQETYDTPGTVGGITLAMNRAAEEEAGSC